MHTHVGAIAAVSAFMFVVFMGTLWRLIAAHLAASQSPTAQGLGAAMLFQY